METNYGFFMVSIAAFAVLLIIILICREIVSWYWKINQRIGLQEESNRLLYRISVQLTANGTDEVYVEEIATGEKKAVKIDKWIDYKMDHPYDTKYRIVTKPNDIDPLSRYRPSDSL